MAAGRTTTRRFEVLAAALVLGGGLLAGCGGGGSNVSSSTTSTTVTTAPSSTTTTAVASPACQTGQLQVSFGMLGAGAGQRYVVLTLTNTGAVCHTVGYVGLQLLAAGQPVPTMVVRTPGSAAVVTLQPGGKASTQLHWAGIPSSDEPQAGPCEPAPDQVEVTPPNTTQFLTATWSFDSVCGHGRIDAPPLTAGVPAP